MNTDNVIRKNHPIEVLKSVISTGATTKIVTLSIIFDETVEIFNVSSDKVREIIKFAHNSKVMNVVS
ncbi:hypothetical protein RDI58_000510 [Solanum bulbocastanum]|uniref:Uncharacterized protein n=1 Tax=Solanum bulbocastanum TaxID=147425 RepID=A0AAN8YSG7_SOLBU